MGYTVLGEEKVVRRGRRGKDMFFFDTRADEQDMIDFFTIMWWGTMAWLACWTPDLEKAEERKEGQVREVV